MQTEMYPEGKRLDCLVAEKVMMWSRVDEDSPDGKRGCKWLKPDASKGLYTPGFSSGIAEAWLIVDELAKRGISFQLEVNLVQENDRRMQVVKAVFGRKFAGMANTVPLAICRAALSMMDD